MHQNKIFEKVVVELRAAKSAWPAWPIDQFEQLAVIGEEFGELQQAVLQHKYEGRKKQAIETEAFHLAVTVFRFLEKLPR